MLKIESEIGKKCEILLPKSSLITKNYYRTQIKYPIKLSNTSRSIYKVKVSEKELITLFRCNSKSTLFRVDYTGDNSDLSRLDIKSKVVKTPEYMNVLLKFINGLLDYYHFLDLEIPEDLIDPGLIKRDHRCKVKVKVTWFNTDLDDERDLLNISILNI